MVSTLLVPSAVPILAKSLEQSTNVPVVGFWVENVSLTEALASYEAPVFLLNTRSEPALTIRLVFSPFLVTVPCVIVYVDYVASELLESKATVIVA